MALDAIVAYKHELYQSKKNLIEALQKKAKPSDRSMREALSHNDQASFICEIKPSSPSKGVIRANADISAIADIYASFASAISVLADEKFFGGSLRNVEKVAKQVSLPVLAKDVVVSPLQVIEARAYGAHAVLLMLSVLDDESYNSCVKVARELQMDFITEVHNEAEMKRANIFLAPIIGINNRNLKTLSIDMKTTETLAPLAHKKAVVIAESGIYNRAQLRKFAPLVHGFLIGTALMKAERIDLAIRELIFGRVKICGLTNSDDAQNAYRAGAYYGGINFAKVSKRVVDLEQTIKIVKSAPLVFGGVFVNQSIDEVSTIANRLNLSFVQIHGNETTDYLMDLRKHLKAGTEIWRAYSVKDDMSTLPKEDAAFRIVLDVFDAENYGGTGRSFDWSLMRGLSDNRYILAGGITPSNVALADSYAPFALDIASGVEDSNPRQKSVALLRELFFNLRLRGCS